MKVIKPQRLSLLQRVVEHERRCTLVISTIAYMPLDAPKKLLTEQSLWKDTTELVSGGVLDEGMPKPCGEILVTGDAFVPDGEPLPATSVRIEMGGVDKRLAVIGDRFWKGSKPTEPVPFEQMPVDWEHAFGGEGFDNNPVGKGAVPIETEHGEVLPLPNVEDPKKLIMSKDDKPEPVGFRNLDILWPQRFARAGTKYDQQWVKTRFPGPAEDFDPHFYNAAPADQWLKEFFNGDEHFVIEGMHPKRKRIEGALEQLVVRAFVTINRDGQELFEAHGSQLDTVHLFPNLMRAALVFRSTIEVAEDDADDVVHLMIAAEAPGQPKPIKHYQRVLADRLDKEKGALAALRDHELMPPEDESWSTMLDLGDMAEMTKLEQLTLANMERGREAKLAETREELRNAGFDPEKYEEPAPELPPPPDPQDYDAVIEYSERMETFTAEQQQKLETQKEQMEQETRKAFEEAGFDYDGEMEKAAGGGPMEFSADEHLIMLHDMARIASEGGQPMEDLEHDLTDPRYEQMLRELEDLVRKSYLQTAHHMPAAKIPAEQDRQMLRVKVTAAKDAAESIV